MDRQAVKKERKEERRGGKEKEKAGEGRKKKNYVVSVDELFRLLSPKYRYADTEKMLIGSVDVNS